MSVFRWHLNTFPKVPYPSTSVRLKDLNWMPISSSSRSFSLSDGSLNVSFSYFSFSVIGSGSPCDSLATCGFEFDKLLGSGNTDGVTGEDDYELGKGSLLRTGSSDDLLKLARMLAEPEEVNCECADLGSWCESWFKNCLACFRA